MRKQKNSLDWKFSEEAGTAKTKINKNNDNTLGRDMSN